MGKRQHQKDKLYLTTTEWSQLYGGRRATADLERELLRHFKRLPFGHCCLSLSPFRDPYCNRAGYVFDICALVPFVRRHKVDPVTGEPAELKDYIKLNFSRDSDNQLQCPVLFKVLTENSHVVAIRTTGNVFSYEAVEQLNLKAKNLRDLLTDEPFTRPDIITLQETSNFERQDVSRFHYQMHHLKWEEEDDGEDDGSRGKRPSNSTVPKNVKSVNQIMRAALDEMATSDNPLAKGDFFYREEEPQASGSAVHLDRFNSANYSTGRVAASLTSTCMPFQPRLEVAFIGDDAYRYANVKKKGYVQLLTSLGPLNLELHCKEAPKTCDNFLQLCKRGYYDKTIFHRLIKHFMVQGGDPTGTGKGGESAWGPEPFKDEFDNSFSHDRRGVLSMANSGKNTNKSQFFVTLKSCPHLDKKHTIFGRLVGGLDTLDKFEQVKTTDKDRPIQDISIVSTTVFVDPFEEIDQQIRQEREQKANEKDPAEKPSRSSSTGLNTTDVIKKGVGGLIDWKRLEDTTRQRADGMDEQEKKKKRKVAQKGFGDFSKW